MAWYIWLFILYFHVLGCIWNLIIQRDGLWIPALEYVDYTAVKYFSADSLYQYIVCFYYMVATIGGNELGPVNNEQFAYISLTIIFASILNALIFGEMSFLVTIISEKETEF